MSEQRKLPIRRAIKHSFSLVKDNWREAFAITWPWIIILFFANIVLNFLYDALFPPGVEEINSSLLLWACLIIFNFILFIATTSLAVNWNQYILQNQIPDSFQKMLRIDAPVWRYMGNGIIIFLAFILLAFIFALILGIISGIIMAVLHIEKDSAAYNLSFMLVVISAMFMTFALISRILIRLVSVCLEEKNFTFKQAWQHTKGNSWRIGIVYFMAFALPVLLMGLIISVLLELSAAGAMLSALLALIIPVLSSAFNICITFTGLAINTTLYGYFVEEREI